MLPLIGDPVLSTFLAQFPLLVHSLSSSSSFSFVLVVFGQNLQAQRMPQRRVVFNKNRKIMNAICYERKQILLCFNNNENTFFLKKKLKKRFAKVEYLDKNKLICECSLFLITKQYLLLTS